MLTTETKHDAGNGQPFSLEHSPEQGLKQMREALPRYPASG